MQKRGGRARVSLAALSAISILVLASCSPQGAKRPSATSGQAAPASSADASKTDDVAAVVVPPKPAPPPEPPPEPGELIGMEPDQVEGRIGEPDHIWREPPAAVWQYDRGECVLHVFLYAKEDGMRVVHFETRLRDDPGKTPPSGCYPGLVEQAKTETGEG